MSRTRTDATAVDTRSQPTRCDCCHTTTEALERLTLTGGIVANACVHPSPCIHRAKTAGLWLLNQPEGVSL